MSWNVARRTSVEKFGRECGVSAWLVRLNLYPSLEWIQPGKRLARELMLLLHVVNHDQSGQRSSFVGPPEVVLTEASQGFTHSYVLSG